MELYGNRVCVIWAMDKFGRFQKYHSTAIGNYVAHVVVLYDPQSRLNMEVLEKCLSVYAPDFAFKDLIWQPCPKELT